MGSMSAAVSNHQLPSYMSGFLYPLGNKKGVYSFVSKPRRVETVQSETLRENILIKRKLKPRLRNRNKKLRKKTLLDVKSLECIEGDKAPIQRLNRNKTKAKLSGQTVRDEPLAKTEKTESLNTELGANIDDSVDSQSYKDSFINSLKVQKVIENLTSNT